MEFDWEDAVNWVWTTSGGTKFRLRVDEDGVVAFRAEHANATWSRWAGKEVVARHLSSYERVAGSNNFFGPLQNPVVAKIRLMEARHKKYMGRKHGMV